MVELHPCPFCGDEAELRNDDDEIMREVVCISCDFAITESANPEGAIARWNTRASGWEDIATAPKDGTKLLLSTANGLVIGFWSSWNNYWTDGTIDRWHEHVRLNPGPDRWMPLPSPPGEGM